MTWEQLSSTAIKLRHDAFGTSQYVLGLEFTDTTLRIEYQRPILSVKCEKTER